MLVVATILDGRIVRTRRRAEPAMTRPAWAIENYRPMLRLYAQYLQVDPRLSARFDGSDVVQDALSKAHEQIEQFRGQTEAELVQWLRAIFDMAFLDRIRREQAGKRDPRREEAVRKALTESSSRLDDYLVDQRSPPDREIEERERIAELSAKLSAALDQLPDDYRAAILLRDCSDCSVAEIAQRLNRTERAVAGLLFRARREMRKLLAGEGESSNDAV